MFGIVKKEILRFGSITTLYQDNVEMSRPRPSQILVGGQWLWSMVNTYTSELNEYHQNYFTPPSKSKYSRDSQYIYSHHVEKVIGTRWWLLVPPKIRLRVDGDYRLESETVT